MPPDLAFPPTDLGLWRPLPDTAVRLGRLRAHGHAQDDSSGVWYELDLVLAIRDRDGQHQVAPALYLAPRLRRAFDLEALREKLTGWRSRALPSSFSPLLPQADDEGFAPSTIELDPDLRWDPSILGSLLPQDLLDDDPSTRQRSLRRLLAREPWALLDPANHLASLYPILEDMDLVDAACAGLMAATARVWAPDPQELRGRPASFSPPSPELDLALQLAPPRQTETEKQHLARFIAVACKPLLGGEPPVRRDQLWAQAKQWSDAARRWRVRDPDEKGLTASDRPSPPPFTPVLVVDEANTKPASGPIPRVASRPMLRHWLCSSRAARFLWVCAAGEPDANSSLRLTPEGTWPSFLERREACFLDVQVEPPDGGRRWISGFDVDRDALVDRRAPGARLVPGR